jgi:hypothetical protein
MGHDAAAGVAGIIGANRDAWGPNLLPQGVMMDVVVVRDMATGR